MKANLLRGPLIKSAIVLLVFSLLVYLTSSNPEASLWSSLGTIIIGAVRLVQWAIGMVIGLAFSIAVLIGIFLLAVGLTDRDRAADMYDGIKEKIGQWYAPVASSWKCDRQGAVQDELNLMGDQLKGEMDKKISAEVGKVACEQSGLSGQLKDLSAKIRLLEGQAATFVDAEKMEEVASTLGESTESVNKLQAAVTELEVKVKKVEPVDPAAMLGDLPGRIEALEQQEPAEAVDLKPLEDKIAALQKELEDIKAVAVAPSPAKASKPEAQSAEKEDEVHRLLAYFDDQADRDKVEELVVGTLKKDMSYAQVTNFLVTELGADKGKVISEHPSLAKDYIRLVRRSS